MCALCVCMHSLHHCTVCISALCACMHCVHVCICTYAYMLTIPHSYIYAHVHMTNAQPVSSLMSNTYSIVVFVKRLFILLHYRYVASLCAILSPFTPLPIPSHRFALVRPLASIPCPVAMYLLPCTYPRLARFTASIARVRDMLIFRGTRTPVCPLSGGSAIRWHD